MESINLIRQARHRAGLSQAELATRAGTSRPSLSAYEHGRVSPTVDTAERVLRAAGAQLTLQPIPHFRSVTSRRGRLILIPTQLTRLPLDQAFRRGPLPLHLNWSDQTQVYDLSDRADRRLVYEIVLREGTKEDLQSYIDGALLIDLWCELTLPAEIRLAWQPLVEPLVTPQVAGS